MHDQVDHRRHPCAECPWRTDVDLSNFSDADFAKLAANNGLPGHEATVDTPMMACHRDHAGTAHPRRLCAGWLAVVGRDHLSVRLKVLAGKLPDDVLDAGPDWPRLYSDLDEMLDHRPGPKQNGDPPAVRRRAQLKAATPAEHHLLAPTRDH
ncbi:MAG: DUF6283 family protein [Micromonosporaceae bacterium]